MLHWPACRALAQGLKQVVSVVKACLDDCRLDGALAELKCRELHRDQAIYKGCRDREVATGRGERPNGLSDHWRSLTELRIALEDIRVWYGRVYRLILAAGLRLRSMDVGEPSQIPPVVSDLR